MGWMMSKKSRKKLFKNKKQLQGSRTTYKSKGHVRQMNKFANHILKIANTRHFKSLQEYMLANFLWCQQIIVINDTCLIYKTSINNKIFALYGTEEMVTGVIRGKYFVTKLEVSYDLSINYTSGQETQNKMILVDGLKQVYADDAKQVYAEIMMAKNFLGERKCLYCDQIIAANFIFGIDHYIWGICPACDEIIAWNIENNKFVENGDIDPQDIETIYSTLTLPDEIMELRRDMEKWVQHN